MFLVDFYAGDIQKSVVLKSKTHSFVHHGYAIDGDDAGVIDWSSRYLLRQYGADFAGGFAEDVMIYRVLNDVTDESWHLDESCEIYSKTRQLIVRTGRENDAVAVLQLW